VELCARQPDGAPLAQHLLAAQRATGRADERLLARPPAAGAWLWGVFLQLHHARGAGGMGPAPITLPDLQAWQQVYGVRLAPWEVETLQAMDHAALAGMQPATESGAAPRSRHGGH
jgi:hypothetical protein